MAGGEKGRCEIVQFVDIAVLDIGPAEGLFEGLPPVIGVILCVNTIADHKDLHILKEAGIDPEGVPLIPIDLVKEAYKLASEPKDILILPCGHFDVYNKEPWFPQAAGAAVEWFKKHIG